MSHVLLDTPSPDKWRLRVKPAMTVVLGMLKSAMTLFLVDAKFAMMVFDYRVSCRA